METAHRGRFFQTPLGLMCLFLLMAGLVMILEWLFWKVPLPRSIPAAIGGAVGITALAWWRRSHPRPGRQ
jgi:hypothetical protein